MYRQYCCLLYDESYGVVKDGNILLISQMLPETIENHPSFILCFLKTKSVNRPTCGKLSHVRLCVLPHLGAVAELVCLIFQSVCILLKALFL